ncbi:permease [Bacillus taeanensis]|uniref:Permease n=1 Tax=Bacillus taeanensis TaxID=273032 RepID=A0A366XRL9_9BACI|nr:permease [Bacillus taeanensis]RBW67419.1 permease [Bacillus taeanensis]
MLRWFRSYLIDFTGLAIIAIVVYFISFGGWVKGHGTMFQLPNSFLQLNTIFLSILIEAIPFVLIGVLIAGFIQIFITEEQIRKWIPKNRFLAVTMSCVVGAFFPACECGIVPIVRRLVSKGVPIYAGVGFLLTGPLINPIVIFSTYMAFGNDSEMALKRMIVGFAAAVMIALIVSFFYQKSQLKEKQTLQVVSGLPVKKESFLRRLDSMLKHSIDEFFDVGKYLILGAFFAAFVQTYVSSQTLLQIGEGVIGSTLVMMGLAFLLSLCSEADAFIAASFRNVFPTSSVLAFLIYGPMIDLKNTFMLLSVFKVKFVLNLIVFITVIVFICTTFLEWF